MSGAKFKRGDRVRIPAGTLVHSMATGQWGSSARAMTVTVDHVTPGWAENAGEHMLSWAGSGGYWRRAAITPEMKRVES